LERESDTVSQVSGWMRGRAPLAGGMSKRPEADTLTDGIVSHNEGVPVGS